MVKRLIGVIALLLVILTGCDFSFDNSIKVRYYSDDKLINVISYDGSFSHPQPTKEGYTFLYWEDVEGKQFEDVEITKSISLYAKWVLNYYDYTLDGETKKVGYNELVSEPNMPFKEGYVLDGFYEDGKKVTFPFSMPSRNLTIKSVYKEQSYEITLVNGGEKTVINYSITMDSSLPKIEKSGFVFDGWYLGDKKLETLPLESCTIYAHFISLSNILDYYSDNQSAKITLKSNSTKAIYGSRITTNDYAIDGNILVIKGDYLNTLYNGTYYYLTSNNEIITINVFEHPFVEDEIKSEYVDKTFTYNGNEYNYFICSYDELEVFASYVLFDLAVNNYQITNDHPYGKYEEKCLLTSEMYNALNIDLLRNIMNDNSTPMSPRFGFTKYGSNVASIDFFFSSESLNLLESSYKKEVLEDKQALLRESKRDDSFVGFKINSYDKKTVINSLYELEDLAYKVKPSFDDDRARKVYDTAMLILRSIVDDDMTDYEKVMAIYSWLSLNVSYDYYVASMNTNGKYDSFTSYGAIIGRLAVCDGIASALKLMCLIEGIEAIEVSGTSQGVGHAWNKVCIDGKWYAVDATWARVAGTISYVDFTYFMKSDLEFMQDHTENGALDNPYIMQVATSTFDYHNYYENKYGVSLDVYTKVDFMNVINYVKKNQRTVIFSCDNIDKVRYFSDISGLTMYSLGTNQYYLAY